MTSIVRYQEHGLDLDCRLEGEQAWLTVAQTANLFGTSAQNIEQHRDAIIAEKELESSTTKQYLVVRTEGDREVSRKVWHLNQDMVLHIGYRVRSDRGADFRRWATAVIKGEAPPLAQPAPTRALSALDMWEMALKAARENEARTAALEAKTSQLEAVTTEIEQAVAGLVTESDARRIAREQVAGYLPAPEVPAPPKTTGQHVVELVRSWAARHDDAFQEGFRLFHKEIRYRCRIDFDRRAKRRSSKRLSDLIDDSGKATEVYAVAYELFGVIHG
jgi:hypothetical protein